ncbi:MAG: M28 family peptidase [Bacteroidales bacterium]|nr:M28 family peptidase [Bacteroidales bacterium]
MRKLLWLACTLLIGCSSVPAQDTNYVRQVLYQLSSQRMHGRGYSFRGDSIAAQFIRSELKRLGVKPQVDNYYQPYTFSTFSMEGPVRLSVNGKRLKPFDEFRIPAWSKSTWGEHKVLNVPLSTILDSDNLKKFLNKHNDRLEDVFVLVDATTPNIGDDKERQKKTDEFLNSLHFRNPFNSRGIIVARNELRTYSPANTSFEHGYAYIEVLKSAIPDNIKKIDCAFFTQFHPQYATQNIYGYVPGEVDTMIVFGAHYDHLGTMGDSVYFPGAHDNGSGVATLLDLARMAVYEKPHYTYVFCFFSGEEAGLRGSKYAVEHPVFDFSKVRLFINIDMFCGGNEGLMVFNADAPETAPFVERIENLNKVLEVAPEIRHRQNRPNSDHWWFSKHMPALYFLSMGQPFGGYHDPNDTCAQCGLEHYINYITLISSLAL